MWFRFDEDFDAYNGGALYVDDSVPYRVAGVLWLDGGQDDKQYFAFVGYYPKDQESYGGILVVDESTAAEAFASSVDSNIEEEIGWFDTCEEGADAVAEYCSY